MPGPKGEEKGFSNTGNGSAAEGGRSPDIAAQLLQSAADLSGLLVVAVVAPLCGRGSAPSSDSSPQRLAVAELRRLVDQKQQQEQQAQAAQPTQARPRTAQQTGASQAHAGGVEATQSIRPVSRAQRTKRA
jgi:hypothetical protein